VKCFLLYGIGTTFLYNTITIYSVTYVTTINTAMPRKRRIYNIMTKIREGGLGFSKNYTKLSTSKHS
jgi:hypothetical protein